MLVDYTEIKQVRKKDKAQSEVSATSVVSTFFNEDNIHLVRQVIKQELTDLEVQRILDAVNLDIEKIKEKYNIISQLSKVNNLVGAMITALKENWTTTSKTKVSTFNDYEQRDYNFDELERKLVGWG